MTMRYRLSVLFFSGVIIFISGCTSRYRLDLYLIADNEQRKVKVERTEYFTGTVLAEPDSEQKLMRGDGITILIETGVRGKTVLSPSSELFSFDEYFRCRILVQLEKDSSIRVIEVADNSLVQIMGRYDLPVEDKLYHGLSGKVVIDSVTKKHLYAAIDAEYRNRLDDRLSFKGKFKVRIY